MNEYDETANDGNRGNELPEPAACGMLTSGARGPSSSSDPTQLGREQLFKTGYFAHQKRKQRISLLRVDAVVSALLGPARVPGNAQPAAFNRQVAMYLAKHVGEWSTTEIGRFYNGRDHSTVCYAIARIGALRESDPEIDSLLARLTHELNSSETCSSQANRSCPTALVEKQRQFDDRMLDELADRVVDRIFSRLNASGNDCSVTAE